MRVCCLALVGALELLSASVAAQEAVAVVDLERPGAFELTLDGSVMGDEDVQIFTPLSPVTVESEPVKLPPDQSLEP